MERKPYPDDLTDAQWALLEPLLPPPKPGGRPRTTDVREVVNAILYLTRTGCGWRHLPHEFPAWPTVHDYYRSWRLDGTWGGSAPGCGNGFARPPAGSGSRGSPRSTARA